MKIPEAALSGHIAILGRTGSGKTYAAKGIVEGFFKQRHQTCVLDPTGAWWGMRLAADGVGPGFTPILIGGVKADIPLAERSGCAIARLVTEQGADVIIDTSEFSVGQYTRWFIDFAGTLYTTIKEPLHLVIDEAHHYMPQSRTLDVDGGKMLHAGNRIMSGGRSKGIRGMLISQRPAKLHKDSLTCAGTLIAMQVTAPQDRKAYEDWIDGCGDPKRGAEVIASLAKLKRGDGWVWYPEGDFLERMHFPAIKTYDSSATPEHGAKAGPKVREINLKEVQAALADAVKEAAANDPKLLRAKIAELQKQLSTKPAVATAPSDPSAIDRAVKAAKQETLRAITKFTTQMGTNARNLQKDAADQAQRIDSMCAVVSSLDSFLSSLVTHNGHAPIPPAPLNKSAPIAPQTKPASRVERKPVTGDGGLSRNLIRCLEAFLWYDMLGITEPTDEQLCYKLGYSPNSSTISVLLSKLRSGGYVNERTITDEGRANAQAPDPGSLEQFHQQIRGFLDSTARRAFESALAAHPRELTAEEFCEQNNWSPTSSTLSVGLSGLRRAGLMEKRGHALTDAVFPPSLV